MRGRQLTKHHIGSHNGHSSSDGKMGKFQDLDKGTWVERYQRRMGWWNPANSSVKKAEKDRAATKRRAHGKKIIREERPESE